MVEMVKHFLICLMAIAVSAFVRAEAAKLPSLIKTFFYSSKPNVKTLWIEQKLDHFNKNDNRTWKMRYMVNGEFYVTGGPLFIKIGGIDSISESFITEGLFYDTARKWNAFLFQTEHRFYGESRPVRNMTIENLKYLNVQQALADLAHFIITVKSSSPSVHNSKIILAGSSYSGTLVTWFKKLYPNLAVGCWASSAPLYAKLDFKEQKEVIGQSIRLLGGDSCYNRIANGTNQMEKMITENRFLELKSALNICNTFDANNELDVASMFSIISLVFSMIVQNHKKYGIQNACSALMEESDDFKGFTKFLLNAFGNDSCVDVSYKTQVAAMKDIQFGESLERQWYYQMCNEFGWFPSTSSKQQPFGTMVPYSFFTHLCKDFFGGNFTHEYMQGQVNKTNLMFGGLNPQVENVYMTHGQLDFWREVGVQDVKMATIIPMASHASDIYSTSDEDSKELKAAKTKFEQLVKEWLKD